MTDGVRVERFAGGGDEWDAFVRAAPGAAHSHQWAWRTVIARAFRQRCVYLAARGGSGALCGVLPLVLVRGLGFGRHLVSLPYLNAGGPLGSPGAVDALSAEARRLARELRADTLEMRCVGSPAPGLPRVDEKVSCVLDLAPGGAEAVWKGFPAKLRSQVRRAEREGMEVRFGPDQAEPFFGVFARHMRDLGTPAHPPAFFRAVRDGLGPGAWFGCVWLDGRPVAGGCALEWRDGVEMTWAASLRSAARLAPNMLLYAAFLRRAADAGLRTFDFGRCTPGGGTHAFKRQWGARDVPLPWVRERLSGRAAPAQQAGGYALASRLWRRVPLPLATLVGPVLRRGIPA